MPIDTAQQYFDDKWILTSARKSEELQDIQKLFLFKVRSALKRKYAE
jgi:hypothetical protein